MNPQAYHQHISRGILNHRDYNEEEQDLIERMVTMALTQVTIVTYPVTAEIVVLVHLSIEGDKLSQEAKDKVEERRAWNAKAGPVQTLFLEAGNVLSDGDVNSLSEHDMEVLGSAAKKIATPEHKELCDFHDDVTVVVNLYKQLRHGHPGASADILLN